MIGCKRWVRLKVSPARLASLSHLSPKHLSAMCDITQISQLCCSLCGYCLTSIYIRGSTVYGTALSHSDLDVVVLCQDIPMTRAAKLKRYIKYLCGFTIRSFDLGIKVFSVDSDRRIIPPTDSVGYDYMIAEKCVNFDIYMNGVCYYGQAIPRADDVFESTEELLYSNRIVWGAELCDILKKAQASPVFLCQLAGYIAKKIFRWYAYNEIATDHIYRTTIIDCYQYTLQCFPGSSAHINMLYALYTQEMNVSSVGAQAVWDAIEALCQNIQLPLPRLDDCHD